MSGAVAACRVCVPGVPVELGGAWGRAGVLAAMHGAGQRGGEKRTLFPPPQFKAAPRDALGTC